jgi:hypothetical protein
MTAKEIVVLDNRIENVSQKLTIVHQYKPYRVTPERAAAAPICDHYVSIEGTVGTTSRHRE